MAKRRTKLPALPHLGLDCPIEAVQPSYTAWQSVNVGMSRAEVVAILGPPLKNQHLIGEGVSVYGYLQFPVMPHPRWYAFVLHFDKDRLHHKEDPFDGVFSFDGTPCKPQIITPPKGAVFKREAVRTAPIDMRWHPVSGQYPMEYEIEMGTTNNRGETFGYVFYPKKIPLPYIVVDDHWRDLPGCFRVRGVNALGAGEWSEYRHFDFDSEG